VLTDRLARQRPLLLLGLGAAGCAALALLPGEVGPLAARAGLATAGVALVAALAARRTGVRSAAALQVRSRAMLGRASCVALVEADGRRFLVGAGERSVELLVELEPFAPSSPPGNAP
jgi:flagellar biogenesis protein FliO